MDAPNSYESIIEELVAIQALTPAVSGPAFQVLPLAIYA